jgi:hypothetical protein
MCCLALPRQLKCSSRPCAYATEGPWVDPAPQLIRIGCLPGMLFARAIDTYSRALYERSNVSGLRPGQARWMASSVPTQVIYSRCRSDAGRKILQATCGLPLRRLPFFCEGCVDNPAVLVPGFCGAQKGNREWCCRDLGALLAPAQYLK